LVLHKTFQSSHCLIWSGQLGSLVFLGSKARILGLLQLITNLECPYRQLLHKQVKESTKDGTNLHLVPQCIILIKCIDAEVFQPLYIFENLMPGTCVIDQTMLFDTLLKRLLWQCVIRPSANVVLGAEHVSQNGLTRSQCGLTVHHNGGVLKLGLLGVFKERNKKRSAATIIIFGSALHHQLRHKALHHKSSRFLGLQKEK
jgi:hypothetical protein